MPKPLVLDAGGQRIAVVAKIVFALYIAGCFAWGNAKSWTQYWGGVPKPPLYGI